MSLERRTKFEPSIPSRSQQMKRMRRRTAGFALAICLFAPAAGPALAMPAAGSDPAGDAVGDRNFTEPSAPGVEPGVENDHPVQSQAVGGSPVPDGTYPFVAAILLDDPSGGPSDYERQFCGGSLVEDNWVLTAAHCVDSDPPASLAVTVGRTVLSSGQGDRFDVAEILVHPRFDSSLLDYDVALLRLEGSSAVPPIRLAKSGDHRYEEVETTLTVAGWGDTDPGPASNEPDRMHSVNVPVMRAEDCGSISDSIWLCAGSAGLDSCKGDSGGPLFATEAEGGFVQMGSVSFGPHVCGEPGRPGVYADLNDPNIYDFINQSISGPLDPCEDTLDPQGEGLLLNGRPVESDNHLLMREFSGKLCDRSPVDQFKAVIDPGPIGGQDRFVGADLTFDPDLGQADLRLKSCTSEQACRQLTSTQIESGPGRRSLRWENKTGQRQRVTVEVVLETGRNLPLSYELDLFVNVPDPDAPPPPPTPPPPTCGEGRRSDDLPGDYRTSGKACPSLPDDSLGTQLPNVSSISANNQAVGAGTIDALLSSCLERPGCENPGSTKTDESGAASLAWTSCMGSSTCFHRLGPHRR